MRRILIAVAVVVVLVAAGVAGWFYIAEQRLDAFAAEPFGSPEAKLVEIPPGTGPKGVAKLAAEAKIVSSESLAAAWLKREKLGPKLKAGEYEFSGPLTPAQVFEKIASGQVKQYHFTVPEGLRVDEILPILANSELKLNLEKLQKLAADAKFVRKLGVPADSLEGFLYPDTYSFPHGKTEEEVLHKMVARTIEEFKSAPRAAGVDYDLLRGITMASIVEKETGAREPEARGRISCVFHNRLRLHMKLQTDPTVIYAKFLAKGVYSKKILQSDLEFEHPYNTYTVFGLPPGPIASPGRASIRAAMNPLDCKDLYFVSKNDGTSVFCPDLKCHNAAVEKYQR